MFVGVAHKNNKVSQHAIAEERAIPILVDLMFDAPSKEVQVEVAYAISCIVLSNSENQDRLIKTQFHFNVLLDLLESSKEVYLYINMLTWRPCKCISFQVSQSTRLFLSYLVPRILVPFVSDLPICSI